MMTMFPNGYEWLGDFPLPKTVNSALWVDDGDDWLLRALADAGKIFVIGPDQPLSLGLIGVSDITLAPKFVPDDKTHYSPFIEGERPDLSAGARRLKLTSAFDPSRVGEETALAALGNIAVRSTGAGVVLGVQGEYLHVLTGRRKVEKWQRAGTDLRKPPATTGMFAMVEITLNGKGEPVRSKSPELWQ